MTIRNALRRSLLEVLLIIPFVAMVIASEWLCYSRPTMPEAVTGRIYPIICRKGGPPAYLDREEHAIYNGLWGVAIIGFGIFGYRLIVRMRRTP